MTSWCSTHRDVKCGYDKKTKKVTEGDDNENSDVQKQGAHTVRVYRTRITSRTV